MTEFKPPHRPTDTPWPYVFLAGSIEMGKAELWQDKVVRKLPGFSVFNPRRDDWDSSWVQDISNPQFKEQVNWELDFIEIADLVFFYFDPKTMSPVTLAELGYVLGRGKDCVVVCPPGFWRRGNVEIMCRRERVSFYDTLNEGIKYTREKFGAKGMPLG